MTDTRKLIGGRPVIGIRPVIDARKGPLDVRGSLEDQTMGMALKAKKLYEENLRYSDGTPVKVVIADSTIGRVRESAACAEKFKKELKVPICTVGSIMNLENAEMILENGWADFVAMARPFLADPQIVRKSACGREDDITPCLRCAYHARGVTKHKVIGCAVNPFCGNETQYPQGRVYPAAVKKNADSLCSMDAAVPARRARTLAQRTLPKKKAEEKGRLAETKLAAPLALLLLVLMMLTAAPAIPSTRKLKTSRNTQKRESSRVCHTTLMNTSYSIHRQMPQKP